MTRRSATSDDSVRILSEWAKGRTYPEIAADLDLAENSVENIIRCSSGPDAEKAKSDHVINMTARKSALHKGERQHAELDEQISAQWFDGKSASEIGKALGVTRNVVIGVVSRNNIMRSPATRQSIQRAAHRDGCITKLAKSERQRDETAQAMVERRAAGKLFRKPPQLELVSSVELPPRRPDPPMDLYEHLRTEDGLRRVLAGLSRPRDIGTGVV